MNNIPQSERKVKDIGSTELSDYEVSTARRKMVEEWPLAADLQKQFAEAVKSYVSINDHRLVRDWSIWRWDPSARWNTDRVIMVDIAEGASETRLKEILGEFELLWHDGLGIHHHESGESYDLGDGKPSLAMGEIHHTDMGNASRFVHWHGDDLLYCHPWRRWLVWDGKRWKPDDTANVMRMAKESVRRIYGEAGKCSDEKERKDMARWALRSESKERIKAIIELAQSEVPVLPDQLDADPWTLTVANGVLDLRTGELLSYNPTRLNTKLVEVEYNPIADCPLWSKFLTEIMAGDETLIAFLQRAVGYSLTGDTSERALFILYGTGANGKSVFLETIRAFLGDYAQRIPTETLLAGKRNAGAATPDIARLKGARFVSASESEEGRRLAEATIKDLTGRDVVTARFLHSHHFDFKPECKIWLATNHKPEIRGTDKGIWDRIKLIPFGVTILENRQDKYLADKLKTELPGILAWAVEGCLAWQCEGLRMAEKVKVATASYRIEQDVLGGFIGDCCIKGDDKKTLAGDLYEAYKAWGGDLSQRRFGMALKERGFTRERKTTDPHKGRIIWQGVGLVTSKDQKGEPSEPSEADSNKNTAVENPIGENDQQGSLGSLGSPDPIVKAAEDMGGEVVSVETADGAVKLPF